MNSASKDSGGDGGGGGARASGNNRRPRQWSSLDRLVSQLSQDLFQLVHFFAVGKKTHVLRLRTLNALWNTAESVLAWFCSLQSATL